MPDLDELGGLERDLRALAAHGQGAAHGWPPDEVRRRGGRRRATRRTTLAAAAVLVVGVAGAAVTSGGDVTTAPPAGPPLTGLLPDGAELAGFNEITGWRTDTTSTTEDRSSPVSVCQQATVTDLGAADVAVRTYTMTADLPPGTVADDTQPPARTAILVARFPDAKAGRAAFGTVADWVRGCAQDGRRLFPSGSGDRLDSPFSEVDATGGQGWTALVSYEEQPPVDPDMAYLDAQAVGLSADGTTIVLVSQRYFSSEYHYTPAQAPITQALERVLQGLAA